MPEDATLDAFVSEAADDEASDDRVERDESSGVGVVGGDAADAPSEEATVDAASDEVDDGASGDDAADSDASGDETAAPSGEPAGGSERRRGERDDEVEPVAVTSSWRSGEAACGGCGESAGRLWEHDGTAVCATCKPWARSGESPCGR